jgi:3D (Asp-Asp-Asp) domain-containing protein
MRRARPKTILVLRRCVRIGMAVLLVLICTSFVAAYWPANNQSGRYLVQLPSPQTELIYSIRHDEPTRNSAKTSLQSNKHVIWMEVTAYCPCKKCCGPHAHGVTASGHTVYSNSGKFVAADLDRLPFGTRLSIPGYHAGQPVPVIDTGYAIRGNRLDVYFPSHEIAMRWGVKYLPVTVEN